MAALQPLPSCRFNLIFVFLFVIVPLVSTKTCKKLDTCSCEMDDGTGIISLQDLDNKDGTARYKNIKFATNPGAFTFGYNPCTPLKTSGTCKGNNLCQDETSSGSTFPCGLPDTTFTMDTDNNVVMSYGKTTLKSTTRYFKVTLKCASKPDPAGPLGSGVKETDSGTLSTYSATFTSKCACPGKCHYSSSYFSSLSIGSILLIIFFPLLILYFVLGIIINKFARKKEGFPDVIPNHSFWGTLPFLVKDGCVFSCEKLKGCCSSLSNRARRDSYAKI